MVTVPARFLDETALPHLKGTFTVLADGGMRDEEILRWLFTPDDDAAGAGLADRRPARPGSRPRCAAGPWSRPSRRTPAYAA